jgi:hypothetical protein
MITIVSVILIFELIILFNVGQDKRKKETKGKKNYRKKRKQTALAP